jgi:hypothetical protein
MFGSGFKITEFESRCANTEAEANQAALLREDDQQLCPGCEDGSGISGQRQGRGDLSGEVEP